MFKKLFIFMFLTTSVYANSLEKVIFVENRDNKNEISLIKEFFKKETQYYTISVAVLNTYKHSPIEFFKYNKLTNAVAYKFGKNLENTRIISGVYKSYDEASLAIKNLSKTILKNQPYVIKIDRHQKQFLLYNKDKSTPLLQNNTIKRVQKEVKDSIYISGSENSEKLKKELLKKNSSKLYAISVATLPSSKKTVKKFFTNKDISENALAHVYGKKRDKVRVIYGLYKNYSDAKNAIDNLNRAIKSNKPYPMKMKHFQNFYRKSNKNIQEENVVELKINDKKKEEKVSNVKLNDEIKVLKAQKPTKINLEKKELPKKRVLREEKKVTKPKTEKRVNRTVKPIKKKVAKKVDKNKDRYLKHSEVEDIYYLESEGNFNILNEVFLNDGSSFYTIDLGEIELSDKSIEEFFLEHNLANNSLAYKYGNKKEYARAIYGAYENEQSANNAIEKLNLKNKELKVSNIKKHQNLFKKYHENILKKADSSTVREEKIKETHYVNKPSASDIIYVDINDNKDLKEEFFKENSPFYTITLTTFHKNDASVEDFISNNYFENDLLAFALGSKNDYYRIIYGVFKTSSDALLEVEKLDDKLTKNKPYVSRIKTTRKRFESYNGRKLSNYKNLTTQIELR